MTSRVPSKHGIRLAILALTTLAAIATFPAPATADDASDTLWMTSAEVGVGPIGDDVFLHLIPRLTILRPMPLFRCDRVDDDCRVLSELSLQVPIRLRIADRPPESDQVFRRRDWHELADFFRVIRRLEYGTTDDPIHVRTGELGPATIGYGTIVGGYYNVITTDHYRPGLQSRIDEKHWAAELLLNDVTGPNLVGLRGEARIPYLYERDSDWQRFTVGTSVITDFTAPHTLVRDDEQNTVAGPDHRPAVADRQATTVWGLDARWRPITGESWTVTPYADINHHFDIGTGVHTGVIWKQDIGEHVRLSSRLEYRQMRDRYRADYFDPLYEVTRYQHPPLAHTEAIGPKLTAAASAPSETRHGGFAQFQARIADDLTVSAAASDGTGSASASLRLRADYDLPDRARLGLFYYRTAHGRLDVGSTLRELIDLDGALAAIEGRATVWGPIYAHGQLARQWRLHDDGDFEHTHLFNVGVGAGTSF